MRISDCSSDVCSSDLAEYRLLHLAGIGGAADQHELLGEIDRDHRLAARAMLRGIGTKARQVDDRIFAVERREFGRGRAAEQGTDELAVPREFGDDLDADAMLGLRAAEELLAIEPVATSEMREEIFLRSEEHTSELQSLMRISYAV